MDDASNMMGYIYTWIYSTGASSPASLLATRRVAGTALGAIFSTTAPREFVTVNDDSETGATTEKEVSQ